MTQVQMAEAMQISERQYQNLEGGASKPGFDQLLFLADFFDVSLDYRVGRSDQR